jgi:perosamine synthetase
MTKDQKITDSSPARRIPVCEPTLGGNELKYVTECLNTNWISSGGKYIPLFEQGFARFCQVKHGVACFNGTTALHLAVLALGIGPGDEVILPTFTMIASANSIIYTGARPVLVDAEADTWNIDVSRIEEKITKKTRAIMPVHIYGHPCDMKAIKDIAEDHNLKIIEDAAEAHGGELDRRRMGSFGDVSAFSFYANKIITTGEGGMVVTDDEKLAEKMKSLRNHCFGTPRFIHHELGYNYRMTNIQAAIGLAQLERIDELVESRRRNAQLYNSLLKGTPGLTLPVERPGAKNVYWMYGILLGPEFGLSKDKAMKALDALGVETRSFFCPMNQQPLFSKKDSRFPDISGKYPVADRLWEEGLYLPSSSHLKKEEIKEVAEKLLSLRRK